MNNASLYKRSNTLQRRDAKQVLDEYAHLLQWRPDETDSLLDIGCGSGDVTIDYILPILPKKFSRLVGCDLSEHMVRHARDTFQSAKVSFEQIDIASVNLKKRVHLDTFDHITSFYCLHWVENQKQAVYNISNLLKKNGDCLLAFLAKNPIFDIYKELAKSNKWSEYMYDVNRFISPYQYSKNAADEFGKLLYGAGFTEYKVVVRDKLYIYDGIDNLKKSVRVVTPFLERMPKDMHENFLDDYAKLASGMQFSQKNIEENDFKYLTPYKLMIAYAKK